MIYHRLTWVLLAVFLLISVSAYRITDTLEQSVPVSYCDGQYTLEAYYISGGRVRFYLNNESSETLSVRQLFEFSDGSRIFVREVLEEESLEGPDLVSFRFYPDMCVVPNESKDMVDAQIIVDLDKENLPSNITRTVTVFGDVPKKSLWHRFLDWFYGWFS